jgi:hypothetical protein
MGLQLLNNKQVEQLKEVLGFYKYFYVCCCGNVYGSDYKEENLECLDCEKKRKDKK